MANWTDRLRAAGIHLGVSLAIAALAAMLVFAVWYPYPYREISGGRELFVILVTVDVILGPLITFSVFNLAKARAELRRDLMIVGTLQLMALAYGLSTVGAARPVHLVFEIDRFRVVHGVEVPIDLEGKAAAGVDEMPWTGPTLLAARPFRSEEERVNATIAALQGVQIGARPDFWMPYDQARQTVLRSARPVAQLRERFGAGAAEIDSAIARSGRPAEALAYLPLVGRKFFWTVLLDRKTADIAGYLPLDPY